MKTYTITLKSSYTHAAKASDVTAENANEAAKLAIAAQGGGVEWLIAAVVEHGSATFVTLPAPELKIDGQLFKGRAMPEHCKLERRIVANLIGFMAFHGWAVSSVYDGEETEDTPDMVSAMELIFNLDDSRVYFFKDVDGVRRRHSVLLVLGNGVDCVADWGYAEDDADGFNSVMEQFDAENYV